MQQDWWKRLQLMYVPSLKFSAVLYIAAHVIQGRVIYRGREGGCVLKGWRKVSRRVTRKCEKFEPQLIR